ncbi:MAG: alpha/beta hydrolase [bacterium]|nr:alpha/beta hydrolase [bacterium]
MDNKYAILKYFKIHYLESGKGECIILLPSLWVTSKSYRSFGEKLKDKFRVIIPDLGNTGRSSGKRLISSFDDYATLLDEFLGVIGVEKSFLVGVSFSGMIAVKYATKFPDKVKGLFLASTALIPVKIKMALLRGLLLGYTLLFLDNLRYRGGLKVNFLWFGDGLIDLIKHPRQFIQDALIAKKTLKNKISELMVPALLLLPAYEPFIPQKSYKDIEGEIKQINNLRIENISGSHGWFFLRPGEFVGMIEKFIEELK